MIPSWWYQLCQSTKTLMVDLDKNIFHIRKINFINPSWIFINLLNTEKFVEIFIDILLKFYFKIVKWSFYRLGPTFMGSEWNRPILLNNKKCHFLKTLIIRQWKKKYKMKKTLLPPNSFDLLLKLGYNKIT